jgi:hypothetical protein
MSNPETAMTRTVLTLSTLALLLALPAAAFEPAADMQSEAERAAEQAPGVWHGQWEISRDHPALRTRGSARAVDLEIWHGDGSSSAQVHWSTGPGICPEISIDEPCEWVGVDGVSEAGIVDGHLYFALPVSADSEDPLFLHLPLPADRVGRGAAANARGGIAFPIEVQRRE